MKYLTTLFLATLALGILMTGCKEDSDLPPEDVGYDFYPYTPGDYLIYDVDSTYYDDFYDTVKHTEFQLKEVFDSYFYDTENRQCIRLERWVKMNDTTDWILRDVWYSCLTNTFAERLEENVRITRLAFPIRRSTEWDGNAFNDNDEQIYEYDAIDEPYSNGTFSSDSTATVIQEISSNLIEDKNQYEIYARHVGLVFKRYRNVTKDFVSGSIVAGVDYSWHLTEYGHN